MDFTKKDLIYLIIIVFVFCLNYNKENLNNQSDKDYLDNLVNDIYISDINDIKRLTSLSNKLIKDGKLKIKSNLFIDDDLIVNNSLSTNEYLTVNKNADLLGNIKAKGTLLVNKDLITKGNGYLGKAYVGKYNKTDDSYAEFSHIDRIGGNKYSLLSHKNGKTFVNGTTKVELLQNNGNGIKIGNEENEISKLHCKSDLSSDNTIYVERGGTFGDAAYIGNSGQNKDGSYMDIRHKYAASSNFALRQTELGSAINAKDEIQKRKGDKNTEILYNLDTYQQL